MLATRRQDKKVMCITVGAPIPEGLCSCLTDFAGPLISALARQADISLNLSPALCTSRVLGQPELNRPCLNKRKTKQKNLKIDLFLKCMRVSVCAICAVPTKAEGTSFNWNRQL